LDEGPVKAFAIEPESGFTTVVLENKIQMYDYYNSFGPITEMEVEGAG